MTFYCRLHANPKSTSAIHGAKRISKVGLISEFLRYYSLAQSIYEVSARLPCTTLVDCRCHHNGTERRLFIKTCSAPYAPHHWRSTPPYTQETFTFKLLLPVTIHWSAVENRPKTSFFRTFFVAPRSIFTVSQIGDREVNLHVIVHPFRIHHFMVRSIAKYLIAPKVLVEFCQEE